MGGIRGYALFGLVALEVYVTFLAAVNILPLTLSLGVRGVWTAPGVLFLVSALALLVTSSVADRYVMALAKPSRIHQTMSHQRRPE